jgi:hypothetical protein
MLAIWCVDGEPVIEPVRRIEVFYVEREHDVHYPAHD